MKYTQLRGELPQDVFARRIGTTPPVVSRIERGLLYRVSDEALLYVLEAYVQLNAEAANELACILEKL